MSAHRARAGVDFGFGDVPYTFARTSYTMSPASMWAPRETGAGQSMKNARWRPWA